MEAKTKLLKFEVFNKGVDDFTSEQIFNKRFFETIIFIFENQPDFIKEYDRLNNSNISKKLSPIENMIDEVSGNRDKELKAFFSFVRTAIFEPVLKREFDEFQTNTVYEYRGRQGDKNPLTSC